jgi:hypothetical protein
MAKDLSGYMLDCADDEFGGHSINSHSLIETLKELDNTSASITDTFEGYSPWEIANHVCYWKIVVLHNAQIRSMGIPSLKEKKKSY